MCVHTLAPCVHSSGLAGQGVCVCASLVSHLILVLSIFLTENLLYVNILIPILWVGTLLYITFSPPVDTEVVSPLLVL